MSFYVLAPVGGDVLIFDAPPVIELELLNEKVSDVVDVIVLERGAREIHLWVDDNGRLRDPVRWNRLAGNLPLAGDLLICAAEPPDSVGLTREEAERWRAIVESWPRL